MGNKRLRGDIQALKQGEAEDDWVMVVRNGPGGQTFTLEHDQPVHPCADPYHSSIIGVDGIARVLLPSGKTMVCKPCTNPKCIRPPKPVTREELQALQDRNRGANAE